MNAPCATSAEEKARAESRLGRQERKKAQQRAFKTGVWDRCRYRVPGRERYCAQPRSPHSAEYCGTHMGESPLVDKGKRVSCPVDPNHTVFEHQLNSHVKICNLALQEARMAQQPYYSRGINSGPSEGALASARDSGTSKTQKGGSAVGVRSEGGAAGPATDGEGDAAALNEAVVLDVISRVVAARRVHVGELRTEVLDPPEVEVLHRARAEVGTGFRKGRHVLQQASIVGHLLKRGLVYPGANTLHVEMGAGRGSLGHAIATAFPGADVTMVERSSIRRKAENRLDGVSTRAKIDIRDLNMAGLPSLTGTGDDRPVVAVAKHLCGAATDLALRAMLTLPRKQQSSPIAEAREASAAAAPPPKVSAATPLSVDAAGGGGGGEGGGVVALTPPAGSDRVGGVAIATCCHHLCNWRDYTGQDYLRRLGFTESDFEVMRRVSAWISLEPDAWARRNNRYPPTPSPHQERERPAQEHEQPEQERERQEQEREEDRPEQEQGLPEQAPEQKEREQERNKKPKKDQKQQQQQQQPRESLNASQEEATTLSDGKEQVREQEQQQQQQEHEHANQQQDAPGAFPALTAAEKASAARECKRLLDGGRMSFLEERLGLRSEVVHFVEREVTPENALLLGFR